MALVGRAARFIGRSVVNHPAALMGGAAAYGVFRAHPLQKFGGAAAMAGLPSPFWVGGALSKPAQPGDGSMLAEAFIGNENAIPQIAHAAVTQGIAEGLSPYHNPSRPAGRAGNYSPDGSMVFGLYNERIK